MHYNENKVDKKGAKFLLAKGFLTDQKPLTFSAKLNRFLKLTAKNLRTKTNAVHISLNFSNKDILTEEKLKAIAAQYMERIGFGNQPFLVYQHFDAAHPHIHIVSTNITAGGKRIETHNLGKIQSENARKEIELQFNLIRAEDQKKAKEFLLAPLQKAEYGKSETKAAISNIVRNVVRAYQFTSLAELNAVLRQFNVTADRGEEGSRMHQKQGLVYSISDEKGNKQGVPIKASSIYSRPTLVKLEEKYALNKEKRKTNKPRLQRALDKALVHSNTKEAFTEALRKKGVRVIFRENEAGRIYGVTFIDNVNRCVFNGSALGKAYSANALATKLWAEQTAPKDGEKFPTAPIREMSKGESTFPPKGRTLSAQDIKVDLLGENPDGPLPYPLRPKKRKRKKRKPNN